MRFMDANHTIMIDDAGSTGPVEMFLARALVMVPENEREAKAAEFLSEIGSWRRWHALEDAHTELTQLVKAECQARILAQYSVFDQLNGNADTDWITAMREYSDVKEAEIAALDMAGCEAYDVKAGWPDTGGLHGPDSMIYAEQADVADSDIPGSDDSAGVLPAADVEAADPDSADLGSLDTSDSGGGLAPFEVAHSQMEVATEQAAAADLSALKDQLCLRVIAESVRRSGLSVDAYSRVGELISIVADPGADSTAKSDAMLELQQHGQWAENARAVETAKQTKLNEIADIETVEQAEAYSVNEGWP